MQVSGSTRVLVRQLPERPRRTSLNPSTCYRPTPLMKQLSSEEMGTWNGICLLVLSGGMRESISFLEPLSVTWPLDGSRDVVRLHSLTVTMMSTRKA